MNARTVPHLANVFTLTLEQVLSRRRKMLMDMVTGIELELRDHLGESHFNYGISILKRALAYATRPHAMLPDARQLLTLPIEACSAISSYCLL